MNIQNGGVEPHLLNALQRVFPGPGALNEVAFVTQHVPERLADVRIIIDNEYSGVHGVATLVGETLFADFTVRNPCAVPSGVRGTIRRANRLILNEGDRDAYVDHLTWAGGGCSKQSGYYRIGYRKGISRTIRSIRIRLRCRWWRGANWQRKVERGSHTELALHTHLSAM